MEPDKDEFDLIMKLLPPRSTDSVLDMGCGNGEFGSFLASATGCKMVFGDIKFYPRLTGKNFVECSMTSTPFADNSFDKIYSLLVISHVENADQGLKEMRYLKRRNIADYYQ